MTQIHPSDAADLPEPDEVRKVREDPASAPEVVMALLADLHETRAERDDLSESEEARQRAEEEIDRLNEQLAEARRDAALEFTQAAEEGHRGARHDKPFDSCPHPVCSRLEEWISERSRGLR